MRARFNCFNTTRTARILRNLALRIESGNSRRHTITHPPTNSGVNPIGNSHVNNGHAPDRSGISSRWKNDSGASIGITGVVGVLQERLEKLGIPAISLRVGVPHYLSNAQHPKSSAALLRHLEHVLGVPTGHGELSAEIERWQSLHDEAVAEDSQASGYVRMLERQFDQRAEAMLPTGDDLAAELEAFLKDLGTTDET